MTLELIDECIENGKHNHKKFVKAVVEKSNEDDYFKAVQRWKYYGENFQKASNCICGHPIMTNCIIHNIDNGNTLITGNCCINKIGFERKHANKSRSNYLELALVKCKNIGETDFVKDLIITFEKRGKIIFGSEKEKLALEKISGVEYRFKPIIGFRNGA